MNVKMVNSETRFTYPSMCFFVDGQLYRLVCRVLLSKKSTPKTRMNEVANRAICDLKIGDLTLGRCHNRAESRPSNAAARECNTKAKGCGFHIYFDPNNKSSSGKMIPMEVATHENHTCGGSSIHR